MKRLIPFTAGLLLALAVCSMSGFLMTRGNIFEHFGRFHQMIAPDSDFFPSARQVRALARASLDRDKINIIIGGSSVFYGVGQPAGLTMADDLRNALGDRYRLINLAMRGGDITGIAEQTAEMMIREGYRVLYVADIGAATVLNTTGAVPYQYFFWDARERGYLMDWPQRDALLDRSVAERPLGARLNALLNFSDLWNTLAYERLMTVFSILQPDHFWRPRKEFADGETEPPRERRYQGDLAADMHIVHAISRPPSEERWEKFRASVEAVIPTTVLKTSVIVVCENSPQLLEQVSSQERNNRNAMLSRTQNILEDLGARSASVCDGFGAADYIDRVHLSVQGASKVAQNLKQIIESITQ